MRGELVFDDPVPSSGACPRRSSPWLVLAAASLTVLVSAAMCAAAVLVPAPGAVVPLVVLICVGCPLFASWQAPSAVAVLRAGRSQERALRALRRTLAQLPETQHPLGLDG